MTFRHVQEAIAMDPRAIDVILDDWRAAERELETSPDDARAAVGARVDQFRDEYRAAMADREAIVRELSRPLA